MFSRTRIVCWPVDYVVAPTFILTLELFAVPQTSLTSPFLPPPPVFEQFCCKHTTCSKSTLGSRRVFHWVTQTFPLGDAITSVDDPRKRLVNCVCHTPVPPFSQRLMGRTPKTTEPWQSARVDCSDGRADTNKIRSKCTSTF
jgi:hypothetical protein